MKNERFYISCTDKRVIVTFIVSIIVAILTTALLCKGGFLPLIPEKLQLAGWICVLTHCYLGWIISLSLLGILLIGFMGRIFCNKNNSKKNN